MAKHKKKKRVQAEVPAAPKKVVNYRRILYLAFCFLVAMTVYQVALRFGSLRILLIYECIGAALLIWYCVVNRGFDKLTVPPGASEELRADIERRIVLGKRILGPFFGVLLTVIVDLIDLYLLDYLRQLIAK